MTRPTTIWGWSAVPGVSLWVLALGCTGTLDGAPPAPGDPNSPPPGSGGSPGSGGTASNQAGTGTGNGPTAQAGSAGNPPTGGTGSGGTSSGGTSSGTGGSGNGQTSSGIELEGTPAYNSFVRLTSTQWENSVRDLLKLSALSGLSQGFAPDPPSGTFANNERALFVSSDLRNDYQRAAETLAEGVAKDAQAIQRVTGGVKDSAAFIRTFGRKAFRRPLRSEEEQRYQTVFASGATLVGTGDAFADGVRMVIESMLQSPNFVYRMDLASTGAPLGGYEIASKLSLFLRDTTPDDALLDAAAAGQFDTAEGVRAKATAMLEEPAAQAVLGRFNANLFGLERYANIDKNRTAFPAYTPALNTELREADQMFFDRLFASGKGMRDILTSPLAFVSSASAPIYGTTASGSGLVETQLGPERPGILTRLGFLALNATLNDPDPIHRGVQIFNRLMCAKLVPPPGTIPPLPTIMAGQTNRQRVEAFTGEGTCGASCHGFLINPIGFAFENFDAVGQLRTTDNGKPVDTAGEVQLSEGRRSFMGAPELAGILANSPSVHGCYTMHLAEYTLARDMAGSDRPLVDRIEGMSMNSNSSVKAIVLALIDNPDFLNHVGGAP